MDDMGWHNLDTFILEKIFLFLNLKRHDTWYLKQVQVGR